MSAHFLSRERLKAWRGQPKDLPVGDNRPEKEFAGKFGFGAAQLPAPSGAAKVAREFVVNAGRSVRVKNATEFRRADGFRDHNPAE
jgi:hypothetical protein